LKESHDVRPLLEKLANNDEIAFRQVFHLYSDKVYSFSLKLTRSRITAEEMVQEVFLRIWINRHGLGDIKNFSGYLFIITRNLVFNTLKRNLAENKTKTDLVRESAKEHCYTEETVIYRDYEELLRKTINHLPPQQRLIYSMCHHEGLPYEEVAQRLKISRLTVKTHMHQALKTIKTQFAAIIRTGLLLITTIL